MSVVRDTQSSDHERSSGVAPDYQPLTAWDNVERDRFRTDGSSA